VAEAASVALIARVPLASGVLTGKFSPGHEFEEGDHRKFNANGEVFNVGETFAGVPFEAGVGFAREIENLAREHGIGATPTEVALRWILDFPAVSTVIPGAKSPEQARANVAAAQMPPLPDAFHQAVAKLYAEKIDSTVRGVY
jgi:aryl-alcohol dehydrogenase-like predicted oxidoreductase